MKRAGQYVKYVNNAEVRVGDVSVEGAESAAKVNALCGSVPPSVSMVETVPCSTPLRGRFVTLERNESRLELAEISVEAC